MMYSDAQQGLPLNYKLLNYASYLVIDKFEDYTNEKPNGLFFNKIMSLLNKKDNNLKLPHYWYRYGDQVCRQEMPRAVEWNNKETDKTKVSWEYENFDYFEELKDHPIEEEVDELIQEYHDDLEGLVDEVYSYAPFRFQKEFLELRKTFYGMKNAYNWDKESYKELTEPIFKSTFETFPIHEFKDLEEEYQLVKKFIEEKLESEDWKFKILEDISKNFWFLFCYHLRLNSKARENIPSGIVHHWEETLSNNASRHRKSIADTIIKSVKKNKDLLENDIINEFYQWRKKDREETKKLIENFTDGLETESSM